MEEHKCPICQATIIATCKCRLQNNFCKNGHEWMQCRYCKELTISSSKAQGHIKCKNGCKPPSHSSTFNSVSNP